jgi:hypothetical protein
MIYKKYILKSIALFGDYFSNIIMLFIKALRQQHKCSARKFTQPFLWSCQNPIEMSEQFVLSHANLYI